MNDKKTNDKKDEKVYCDECEHHELEAQISHLCMHPEIATKQYTTRDKYEGKLCREANPNGDCGLFKTADGIRVTGEALNNIAPVIEAAQAVCLGYYKKPFDMMDGVEMDDLQAALEAFEKETGDE